MEKLRRMRAGARFGAGRDHFAQCANCGVVVYTSILMPDDAGRILRPRIAILDELDSGLDVDALGQVARRIERATRESDPPLGVIAITHYRRLLAEPPAHRVHVLSEGRIVASGGPELAEELERTGYVAYREDAGALGEAGLGALGRGPCGARRAHSRSCP